MLGILLFIASFCGATIGENLRYFPDPFPNGLLFEESSSHPVINIAEEGGPDVVLQSGLVVDPSTKWAVGTNVNPEGYALFATAIDVCLGCTVPAVLPHLSIIRPGPYPSASYRTGLFKPDRRCMAMTSTWLGIGDACSAPAGCANMTYLATSSEWFGLVTNGVCYDSPTTLPCTYEHCPESAKRMNMTSSLSSETQFCVADSTHPCRLIVNILYPQSTFALSNDWLTGRSDVIHDYNTLEVFFEHHGLDMTPFNRDGKWCTIYPEMDSDREYVARTWADLMSQAAIPSSITIYYDPRPGNTIRCLSEECTQLVKWGNYWTKVGGGVPAGLTEQWTTRCKEIAFGPYFALGTGWLEQTCEPDTRPSLGMVVGNLPGPKAPSRADMEQDAIQRGHCKPLAQTRSNPLLSYAAGAFTSAFHGLVNAIGHGLSWMWHQLESLIAEDLRIEGAVLRTLFAAILTASKYIPLIEFVAFFAYATIKWGLDTWAAAVISGLATLVVFAFYH